MQISKEELPIIKSGLDMKKKALSFKLKQNNPLHVFGVYLSQKFNRIW